MATAGTNGRCACRRRRPMRRRSPARSGRRPTSTRTRTGGTARTSMAAARPAQASLRAGRDGKVLVSPSGRLGVDPVTGREITGFTENGWVGLSLLHALFALEHNAICDELKKHNPHWDDERLFQQARLVNSALLAKIHTVEWSTAILPREVLQHRPPDELVRTVQQAAEPLSEARRQRHLLRDSRIADRAPRRAVLADRGVRLGLPHAHADAGSLHDQVGEDRRGTGQRRAAGAVGPARRRVPRAIRARRICSTRSGSTTPAPSGCTTIRSSCRTWCRTTASGSTSAPIDILRDRERGVPRYNRFRRLLQQGARQELRGADRRTRRGPTR